MDPQEPNSEEEEIILEEEESNQVPLNYEELPFIIYERNNTENKKIIEEKESEYEKLQKSSNLVLQKAKENFYQEFLKNCVK